MSLFVSNSDDVLFCYFDKRVTEYLFKSSQFVVKTKIKSQRNEITEGEKGKTWCVGSTTLYVQCLTSSPANFTKEKFL